MRYMKRLRQWSALLCIGVLAACSGNSELEQLRQAAPKGTVFQNELAKLYLTYAEVEQQYGRYDISSLFAEKGLKAAYGNDLLPDAPKRWNVPDQYLSVYKKRRQRLMGLLDEDMKKQAPRASAGAVFYYDCMLSQHEKAPDGEEFQYCKTEWRAMMGDLREARASLVSKQSFDVQDMKKLDSHERFLVYFALDDFSLNDAAERTVKLLYEELTKKTNIAVVVNGHTDTSGGDRYNMVLSNRRADTVKKMLVALGMDPKEISTFGFGETDLNVQTGDGVVERKNRRVEIVVN